MRKTIKTRSGKTIVLPTEEEDKIINEGIASDPDTYELSENEIKNLKPARLRGRPKAETTKEQITLRLSRDVIAYFRSTGAGWQTRIDAVLKDYLDNRHQ